MNPTAFGFASLTLSAPFLIIANRGRESSIRVGQAMRRNQETRPESIAYSPHSHRGVSADRGVVKTTYSAIMPHGDRGVSAPSSCDGAIYFCTCLEKQGSHRRRREHREKTEESSWDRLSVGLPLWERQLFLLACLKNERQERAHRWISLVSRDFVGFRSQPAGYPAITSRGHCGVSV